LHDIGVSVPFPDTFDNQQVCVMALKKIYKIIHEYEAGDTGHDHDIGNTASLTPANLPVPLRSGPYTSVGKHIHARNSAAFITQLLETNRQNEMLHGRFERSARRARHAYSQAASLYGPSARDGRAKHLFI
jgi:hypothetical protein